MRTFEQLFAPYEQALALKELKFDEPCLKYYVKQNLNTDYSHSILKLKQENFINGECLAPTYAQAFDFIRTKYRIESWVQPYLSPEPRRNEAKFWYGGRTPSEGTSIGIYDTHLEAELECLKHLIQFIKEHDEFNI